MPALHCLVAACAPGRTVVEIREVPQSRHNQQSWGWVGGWRGAGKAESCFKMYLFWVGVGRRKEHPTWVEEGTTNRPKGGYCQGKEGDTANLQQYLLPPPQLLRGWVFLARRHSTGSTFIPLEGKCFTALSRQPVQVVQAYCQQDGWTLRDVSSCNVWTYFSHPWLSETSFLSRLLSRNSCWHYFPSTTFFYTIHL